MATQLYTIESLIVKIMKVIPGSIKKDENVIAPWKALLLKVNSSDYKKMVRFEISKNFGTGLLLEAHTYAPGFKVFEILDLVTLKIYCFSFSTVIEYNLDEICQYLISLRK